MQRPDERWYRGWLRQLRDQRPLRGLRRSHVHGRLHGRADRAARQLRPAPQRLLNCDNPMLSEQQRDLICTEAGYGTDRLREPDHRTRATSRAVPGTTCCVTPAAASSAVCAATSTTTGATTSTACTPRSRPAEATTTTSTRPHPWTPLDVIEDPETGELGVPLRRPRLRALEHLPGRRRDPGGPRLHHVDAYLTSGATTQMVNGTLFGDLEDYGLTFPSASEGIQVAVGAEYREESLYVRPDEVYAMRPSRRRGRPDVPVDGSYDVTELFIEALVPIVQDATGFRDLSLELGYRYSDYSTSGSCAHLQGAARLGADRFLEVPRRLQPRDPRAQRARAVRARRASASAATRTSAPARIPAFTQAQCANTGVTAVAVRQHPGEPGRPVQHPRRRQPRPGSRDRGHHHRRNRLDAAVASRACRSPSTTTTSRSPTRSAASNADDIIQTCATTGDPRAVRPDPPRSVPAPCGSRRRLHRDHQPEHR